jgi:hypothetical protein
MLAGLPLIVKYGAVALVALMLAWVVRKAFKGEYREGFEDGESERAEGWRELSKKLYGQPRSDDEHFTVRMPERWRKTAEARTHAGVEPAPDRDNAGRHDGGDTMPDR